MSWLMWHKLHSYVRNSSWTVPAAAIPVALLFSPLTRSD